jgi:UPF0176 protein
MTNTFFISTFYHFKALQNLEQIKKQLKEFAQSHSINGLVILAPEGINSTFSARSESDQNRFKNFLKDFLSEPQLSFKDSTSLECPFRRFSVKIREEIVTLNTPDLIPDGKNHHLTPAQWNQVLKTEKDFVMIDTRNWYETKIGTFKGAITPATKQFTEFPQFIEEQKLSKNQKMLIFCTGGVRCEKGILDLQKRGYENVYQLEGGILKYLEEFPFDQFEGECFVFDNRVAVDQNLKPSKTYKLCPHCGQPASIQITCKRCDHPAPVCDDCLQLANKKDTCSKHCAHWFSLDPNKKGKHQNRVLD